MNRVTSTRRFAACDSVAGGGVGMKPRVQISKRALPEAMSWLLRGAMALTKMGSHTRSDGDKLGGGCIVDFDTLSLSCDVRHVTVASIAAKALCQHRLCR